jgi:DNA invertase Pin-like site-specific DNA recombinase
MKKTAILYVRSTRTIAQAEKQLDQLWKFAINQNYSVSGVFHEEGTGVGHVCGRTIWQILKSAEDHEFDTVIMSDVTRTKINKKETRFVINQLDTFDITSAINRAGKGLFV